MDQRIRSLNKAIQSHDSDLFARRDAAMINVFRRGSRWETHELDGFRLLYSRPDPKLILSLTDTWNVRGKPVEWGIEPVIQRLKSIDSHGDFNEVRTLVDNLTKMDVDKERARDSRFEDLAKEMRPAFRKAFSDINTSTLAKIDKRRVAHGNR